MQRRRSRVRSVVRRLAILSLLGPLLFAPTFPRGALGRPDATAADAGSLQGRLLVATEDLKDPHFAGTVIYMIQHGPGGALGLIVNRPGEEVPIALLMDRLGLDGKDVTGSIRLHYGGPVEPRQISLLHSPDYRTEGTTVLQDGVAVTGEPEILRALGSGKGPRRSLLALGYAGWAPGQLEREIAAGAWVTVPGDPELVFGQDDDKKWEKAMARHRIEL